MGVYPPQYLDSSNHLYEKYEHRGSIGGASYDYTLTQDYDYIAISGHNNLMAMSWFGPSIVSTRGEVAIKMSYFCGSHEAGNLYFYLIKDAKAGDIFRLTVGENNTSSMSVWGWNS